MSHCRAGDSSASLLLSLSRSGSSSRLTFRRCRATLRLCVLTRIALFATRRSVFRERTGNAEFITLSNGSMSDAIFGADSGTTPLGFKPGNENPGRCPSAAVVGSTDSKCRFLNGRAHCRSFRPHPTIASLTENDCRAGNVEVLPKTFSESSAVSVLCPRRKAVSAE